jgi:hypothetical protein
MFHHYFRFEQGCGCNDIKRPIVLPAFFSCLLWGHLISLITYFVGHVVSQKTSNINPSSICFLLNTNEMVLISIVPKPQPF